MEDLICLLATVRTLNTDSELLDLLINMPVYREVLKSVNDNTFKRKIELESFGNKIQLSECYRGNSVIN